MLSTTTMALSTIMPIAMTSAPNDMRCRSIFSTAIKMKVPRITKTKPVMPTTSAGRNPIATQSTARTIKIAAIKFLTKSTIEWLTRSPCQATR